MCVSLSLSIYIYIFIYIREDGTRDQREVCERAAAAVRGWLGAPLINMPRASF